MLVVKRFYHVVIHDEMSQPNYPSHVDGQNDFEEEGEKLVVSVVY
jgi:hypothetical protein